MQIRVKLYASLSKLLPEGVKPHEGFLMDIDEAMTPNELIDALQIPRPMAHLILRNGTYIKPADRDSGVFQQDDVFAVWPPVAGG